MTCKYSNCSSLTSVTLGSGVTYIGNYAFYSCGITFVKMGNAVPIEIKAETFTNCMGAILQVPTGSKAAYQSADYWKEFKRIVEDIVEGDVNVDEQVNVVDVVDIARFVVEDPSEFFFEFLADINADGAVNLGDAVALVNDIAGDQNFVKGWAAPSTFTSNDAISLTERGGCLSMNLENEHNYTAFQFDLFVPEDVDVAQMMLNAERKQGHQLLYNKVESGHYRVAALSISNNDFKGNEGELLKFALNEVVDNKICIRGIHFFDAEGNDYLFDDIEGAIATRLNRPTSAPSPYGGEIYDLQGRKREQMQRGVNIVNGKKIMVK